MKPPDMTSNKPYLIRAIYDWILDNHMVPHLLVDAHAKNVRIPMQYVQDGKIILNISPQAAQRLHIDNQFVTFGARFSGVPMEVYAPVKAVLAIYARETGAGMVFDPADENDGDGGGNDGNGDSGPPPSPASPRKPKLTLVKS